VRVLGAGPGESRVYARNHSFGIGRQASFRESDTQPSAIEYLLGALGGDLVAGWQTEAERAGVRVHALELSLSAWLDNPLVHLAVIGESGHPGLAAVTGALYVSAEADEETLNQVWRDVLARSPLYATLSRCVALSLELKPAT
jgi:hypothetical protein